ncbi:hypothetical protein [Streptomyces sp. NPDC001536]|uniref:hypothetical protein n=1 Tax=Streptomyces sp. NPDC001536 TaxID=3364583 RepID=UPI0036CD97CA
MSMWLKLAKIEPSLLGAVPEGGPEPDFHAFDFRTLTAVAADRAEVEEGAAEWTKVYPWLARSTGHGCEVVEGHEFGYGPGFVLTPDEVRQVAVGLVAEGWTRRGTTAADWDEEGEDHGLEDLGPFFTAAASEGKAVIGGVD